MLLRHNQNVQIPLFKKSLSYNFFLRKASSLWNYLPLEIKSSASHTFLNRLNSHYHISKKSTPHLLGLNPQMTSIRCMLRFAHSPLNISKNNYVVKWQPNYTYSSIVTFTAQHEQHFITKFMFMIFWTSTSFHDILIEHFITKFMIFWTKPALLNDLSAWVIPICCAYIYVVCRLPFQ